MADELDLLQTQTLERYPKMAVEIGTGGRGDAVIVNIVGRFVYGCPLGQLHNRVRELVAPGTPPGRCVCIRGLGRVSRIGTGPAVGNGWFSCPPQARKAAGPALRRR